MSWEAVASTEAITVPRVVRNGSGKENQGERDSMGRTKATKTVSAPDAGTSSPSRPNHSVSATPAPPSPNRNPIPTCSPSKIIDPPVSSTSENDPTMATTPPPPPTPAVTPTTPPTTTNAPTAPDPTPPTPPLTIVPNDPCSTPSHDVTASVLVDFSWTVTAPQASAKVSGSFSNWTQPLDLHPQADAWTISIPLPPGTYTYKFIIDGEWMYDVTKPTQPDDQNNINNVITIE
mmetsp:Transcript_2868/g.5363  ORF Transcript_2868/g.5363 Transcript_2868/m.5363 type:complete len:233 (-) Transcript_2868:298-996(-)|eukprot:CAMPEP_0184678616 /NCGR_PEP_ID=MMETSP0312-20130426/1376_1 /TAXON_ID=31354 /ORGANISM="Compsopogon coeruleus, Strain SAG 36.94" /LENGTH=232 /DNA_ID=CAMNT_0027127483 /DNA_START=947 /DNA_END=1645 /DNA_ORIENTATION=-